MAPKLKRPRGKRGGQKKSNKPVVPGAIDAPSGDRARKVCAYSGFAWQLLITSCISRKPLLFRTQQSGKKPHRSASGKRTATQNDRSDDAKKPKVEKPGVCINTPECMSVIYRPIWQA